MAKTRPSRVKPKSALAAKLTRRERSKGEKLERIRAAAHQLFSEQGYDNTTTKQIAAAADIGAGTLFLYAPTKQDLLVLIFQDEVGRAVDAAFASTTRSKPLLEQVMHVFNAIIEHHAADPGLARVFVKELPFVEDSSHGVQHFMTTMNVGLAALIDRAKTRGEIAADVPSKLLAQNLFGTCFQHLQILLRARPATLGTSDAALKAALDLQLRGARKPGGENQVTNQPPTIPID